jgi:hypothetical protein
VGLPYFSSLVVDDNFAFQDPPTSNCTFEAGRSSAIQYGFVVAYELCKDIWLPSHLSANFKITSTVLMSLTVFKRYQDYRDSNSRLVRAIFQGGVRYMTAIICAVTFGSI